MIDLSWKDHLPEESLDGGLRLLKRLRWHIEYGQNQDGQWVVKTGHSTIFRADHRDALDAFLYGMSLAYGVMPESFLSKYREYMLREEGYDPQAADIPE